MIGLIDQLRAFNAKERHWLIVRALGAPALAPSFAAEMGKVAETEIPAEEPWWAMDFHLDWVEAAIACVRGKGKKRIESPLPEGNLNANQEDVDLLVAWDGGPLTHLLFVEAKGVISVLNKRFRSKMLRLGRILGDEGERVPGVRPHYVLVSPGEPRRLTLEDAPSRALRPDGHVRWSALPLPPGLVKPERGTETEEGLPARDGLFWQVTPRRGYGGRKGTREEAPAGGGIGTPALS